MGGGEVILLKESILQVCPSSVTLLMPLQAMLTVLLSQPDSIALGSHAGGYAPVYFHNRRQNVLFTYLLRHLISPTAITPYYVFWTPPLLPRLSFLAMFRDVLQLFLSLPPVNTLASPVPCVL